MEAIIAGAAGLLQLAVAIVLHIGSHRTCDAFVEEGMKYVNAC